MDVRFTRLFGALAQLPAGPPADLAAFIHARPDSGVLPSPWETWVLFGLVRHRRRQLWVGEVIRTRLRGHPRELAAAGALGHPDGVPQSGIVPGLPEWEYFFHGRGCCLTHKVDGDAIDVNFHDDVGEYFDTYFYIRYLKSLRRPEPPEERLRALFPSFDPAALAFTDLLAAGALSPLSAGQPGPPRLSDAVLAHTDVVDAFCRAWADPARRSWLAALVGDWPAAHAAGGAGTDAETAHRVAACNTRRAERLEREIRTNGRAADALLGLADLGGSALPRWLEDALRAPPSGLVSTALAVVGRMNDPTWCRLVYAAYRNARPGGPPPEPHIWLNSLKILIGHGYRPREMRAALAKAGGSEVGEAVLLALEYAPERALPLIRKSLLGNFPVNRSTTAAILALVNKPWSIQELLRALAESDDQEKTVDARTALLETGNAEAERAVLAWEDANPREPEAGSYLEVGGRRLGPFYSMAETMLANRASRIRYEMDQLRDRVARVREVVPPEPAARPWWKVWRG
jgi:hypothetical protein